MPQSKTPIMRAVADELTLPAGNPFDALLPEDRLQQLQALPMQKRQEFYGRVVNGVFSDPAYQDLVFNVAKREFDSMTGGGGGGGVSRDELRGVVESVVDQVLRARGK